MKFCIWKLLNFEKISRKSKFRKTRYLTLGLLLRNTSFPESFFGTWQHMFVKTEKLLFSNIFFIQVFQLTFTWNSGNSRKSRSRFKICSNLTIKITERRHWRHLDVFIVNFEHISHLFIQSWSYYFSPMGEPECPHKKKKT